jgi:hypothetical protein
VLLCTTNTQGYEFLHLLNTVGSGSLLVAPGVYLVRSWLTLWVVDNEACK